MYYRVSQDFSRLISFLRFPLMLLLAFDHFNINSYDLLKGLTNSYAICLSKEAQLMIEFVTLMGMCVVPSCFLISGALAFNGWDESIGIYHRKLKSRVRTLLVPYLIWNTLFFVFLGFYYQNRCDVTYSMSIISFIAQYWDVSQFPWFVVEGQDILPDGPLCSHLWFIRYLMGLIVVSPFLWIIVKKWPKQSLLLTGILWLIHPSILHYSYQIGYLGFGALFFFLLGAYITSSGGGKISILDNIYVFMGTTLSFGGSFIMYYYYKSFPVGIYVERIAIMSGIAFLFSAASVLTKKGVTVQKNISNASFMIYAMHLAFIPVWRVIWVEILNPSTCLSQLALWLLTVISNVSICVLFDMFTKKYTPKLNSLLTGGR